MISPALAALREHLRRGDLDGARALAVPADEAGVAAVYLAGASGDVAAATTAALACLDAGRAERVVIATVVAHVPRSDPRWLRAAEQLELVDALTEVAERPADGAAWDRLLELLIDTRRRGLAVEAVRAATRDGAGEEPWQRLIAALIEAGDPERALAVAREACRGFDSATVWAMRAIVAVETDRLAEAADAVDDAGRLDPRAPLAWVARSRLAWARGDDAAAVSAAATAIELGAPRPVVEAGARGARLLQLLLGPR